MSDSNKINGKLSVRPRGPQPNSERFYGELREERRRLQTDPRDGKVYCAFCAMTEDVVRLEMHHRHYEYFGEETIHDIVLVCPDCHHERFTTRIRAVTLDRYDVVPQAENSERSYRPEQQRRETVAVIPYTDERKLKR